MKRRFLAATALAAAALVTLVGCSGGSGGSGSDTSSSGSASTTLRVGLLNGINTLDPDNTASVGTDLSVIGSVYSSLVRATPDGKITGDLATSWKQTAPTTWSFQLNPKASFSNGDKVTPETIEWNFSRLADASKALRLTSFVSNVAQVTADGSDGVTITTKQPDSDLVQTLSFIFMLDPSWAQKNDPSKAAMGSGPYTLTSYTPQGPLSLKARSDYWGKPASIKTVNYLALGSEDAAVNALVTGEVDLIAGVTPQDTSRLSGKSGISVKNVQSSRAAFVKFNTEKTPLQNATVRQALNYAVDKDALIKSVLKGSVTKSQGQILTPNFTGYDSSLKPYPYDPKKAKQLLADAGYPNGFTLDLQYPTDTYVDADTIVQAVSNYLAKVGVTVHISSAPYATYLAQYVQQGNMPQSIYITQSWQTTAGFLGLFAKGSPYSYWPDDTFAGLLNQAEYAPTKDQSVAAYHKALEYFRDQAPVLFLFPQPDIYGTNSKLSWTPSPFDWILPYDMSFSS